MKKLQLWAAIITATAMFAMNANEARAVDGDLLVGFTSIQKSLAGAGVANSEGAGAIAINPAGIVDVGHQSNVTVGGMIPYPGYTGINTGFIAPGQFTSDQNFFPEAAFFYNQPIDAESAFAVGIYANGGLGTSIFAPFNKNTGTPGVFGTGVVGINLFQAFISAGYAHRFGNVSVGVAPIFAVQRFNAWGVAPFAAFSITPSAVSNQGYDWGVGVGLRAGMEWNIVPGLRFALAGATPVVFSELSLYRGLLPDQGTFNAPATITAGAAWDVSPNITLLFDYKHIFFADVAAFGNSSQIPPLLGSMKGPGFRWRDMNVFTIAGEWRINPAWTLRAGYARNNTVVRPQDIVFNILAPVITTDHISAGFSYRVTEDSFIDTSATLSPRRNLSGTVPAGFGGGTVNLTAWVFEASIGWTYKFNTTPAPVFAKY